MLQDRPTRPFQVHQDPCCLHSHIGEGLDWKRDQFWGGSSQRDPYQMARDLAPVVLGSDVWLWCIYGGLQVTRSSCTGGASISVAEQATRALGRPFLNCSPLPYMTIFSVKIGGLYKVLIANSTPMCFKTKEDAVYP